MGERLLATAVDVRRWLDEDAETPYTSRLERDRAIGRRLSAGDSLDRVLAWWSEVAPGQDPSLGHRVVLMERLARWLLGLFGLVLGAGLGSIAFAYDGTHPVNLLGLLGVLVGTPFVLLVLTLIFLLPFRIPGLAALREGIGVINPGRWVGAWLDRYARMDLYAGFGADRTRFARWQLVVFTQWFAVGYFVGVLLAGVVLVAVTDLAFGWSSTLNLDAAAVQRLFGVLALPWQAWIPQAVPDAALVEASRFYRLETAPVGEAQAMRLGTWWPFVLCTIVFWGLLPRLVLLAAGRWRLAAATRSLICQDPEVLALIDRLTPPRVDFGPEEAADGEAPAGRSPAPPAARTAEGTVAVIWNEALPDTAAGTWAAGHLGGAPQAVLHLSSRSEVSAVASLRAVLAADEARVLIYTKGWEPPLLEFGDFLTGLRDALGPQPTFVVVPINTRADGVDPADREVWAGFLARHGDPRLYVQQATTAGAGPTGPPVEGDG
ncbi:MAG: DUF2868 domain-containing protein [Pseudomonadales bacterium]|jgi:hypothetical protein